jgi:hypothetical protein
MVLESQPMLSDLLTESTGPLETIAWKVGASWIDSVHRLSKYPVLRKLSL